MLAFMVCNNLDVLIEDDLSKASSVCVYFLNIIFFILVGV